MHLQLILITSAIIIHGLPNDLFGTIELDDIAQVKSMLLDLSSRVRHLEKKNQELEKKDYEQSTRISSLENEKRDINDELEYLKELTKLTIVRTCEELHQYGINKSDLYYIDPDGPLTGKEPIRFFCDFTEDGVTTKISHDSEEKFEVDHCNDPGCYSRKINYDAPLEQIQSLIDISEVCTQQILYDCYLSPLQDNGINYGFWLDKYGESQYYWTGAHRGEHVCSCQYSEDMLNQTSDDLDIYV